MSRPILSIEPRQNTLIVRFFYTRDLHIAIKAIGGGHWEPDLRAWIFPYEKSEALQALNAKLTLDHLVRVNQQKKEIQQQKDQLVQTSSLHVASKPSKPAEVSANKESHFNMESRINSESPITSDSRSNSDWVLALENYLKLKGYSPKTVKSYRNHLSRFLEYSQGRYDKETIYRYLLEQLEVKLCSHTHANQAINAIKQHLIQRGLFSFASEIELPRPKREHKLPKVMSKEEVQQVLAVTENLKHRTALMVAYSCGMRVGEVSTLRINDIDYSRNLVLIRQGKGRKDRIAPLSARLISQLEQYLARYRPLTYVFENPDASGPISDRTLQVVFNRAVEKVGIDKTLSFHSLRHSFATHLLESGVDLRYIQELLGHKNSKTTEIYTHVSNTSLQRIVNPLDQLDL